MRHYISPLGFDTSHILSLIVKYGFEAGDSVTVLMPSRSDERSETAFESVKEMLHKIDAHTAVDRIHLNQSDQAEMVKMCINVIERTHTEESEASVIVSLSGGAREILVALTIAAVSRSPLITKTACYSDVTRQLIEIDLPYFVSPLQRRDRDVLRDIQQHGPTSLSEIAVRLQISESTVSRSCARVVSQEMIILNVKGKSKVAEISQRGAMTLSIGAIN